MVAGNAVNNVTYDNNKGSCAQTTEGTANDLAWWQVDLGDTYLITGITIFNRQKHGKLTRQNTTLLANATFVFLHAIFAFNVGKTVFGTYESINIESKTKFKRYKIIIVLSFCLYNVCVKIGSLSGNT